MATYKQIQERVKAQHGVTAKTCWIAHVMSDNGLTQRQAPNRINSKVRKNPCPVSKRGPIVAALRHFRMM